MKACTMNAAILSGTMETRTMQLAICCVYGMIAESLTPRTVLNTLTQLFVLPWLGFNMSKCISSEKLSDNLSLAECKDGFWLYASDVGMNISVRAKTKEAALLKGLQYYQRRFHEYKTAYESVQNRVNDFIASFPCDCENEDEDSF